MRGEKRSGEGARKEEGRRVEGRVGGSARMWASLFFAGNIKPKKLYSKFKSEWQNLLVFEIFNSRNLNKKSKKFCQICIHGSSH